jgi:hypothetical protein
VRHSRIFAALALAAALPAAAHTFGFSPASQQRACLSIGNATWRFTDETPADVTVRIDPAAAAPNLRIRLAETAEEADFVLVDDGAPPDCRAVRNLKSVRVARGGGAADLTIAFTAEPTAADYRIYVRSRGIAPETAAALFAAANTPPKRVAAARSDRSD